MPAPSWAYDVLCKGGDVRIVSFTRSVPYTGIPHAGGEYYLRHLRVLLDAGHEVAIVAPDDEENRVGIDRCELDVRTTLINSDGSQLVRQVDRFNGRFRVAYPAERFLRNVGAHAGVQRLTREADLLEFQWTEFVAIYGRLKREYRMNTPTIAVAHDVLTQKLLREARDPRLTRSGQLFASAKHQVVRHDERRLLRRMSTILTFSDKDAVQLRRVVGVKPRIQVIAPPLEPHGVGAISDRSPDPRSVLMVGAFSRPENAEGASWFLEHVWPVVLESVPDARICFAGERPSDAMLERAARDPSVLVTGYVDDLAPFYRTAAVAVVPLHLGAGVKFKTITAMLWGVPIVSTPVGAEGIVASDSTGPLFVAIEHGPSAFAAAVVHSLTHREEVERIAAAARRTAEQRYGFENFTSVLTETYEKGRQEPTGRQR